jgi:3-oxoacyl-[acyl-carrier-protein] synthase II
MTAIATALSWARARASSSWRSLNTRKARGAKIYAEVIGYGLSGDAYHITSPAEDGDGAYRCMAAALKRARISASDIDYINAHGTSTPLGDEIELKAIERMLGNSREGIADVLDKVRDRPSSSALPAPMEAIFSILTIRDGILPPTLNLDHPSVDTPIDLVPHKARRKTVEVALSNSFGFGGTNASLIFRHVDA